MRNEEQIKYAYAGGQNLKEYFCKYIMDVRGCKRSTAVHYMDALKKISNILREKNLVKTNIFEIGSLEQLDMVWDILNRDNDFVQLDKRGHNMYSAGFRNYRKFASGQEFQKFHDEFAVMDTPMQVEDPIIMEYQVWKRSGILRTQTIEYADYSCEFGAEHKTFIAASTNKPYMEAHHVIPLHLQGNFQHSLDVYANLICLCPICHRRIHYGIDEDRREMLDIIYEKRRERLIHSGIILSKENFEHVVLEG